MASSPTCDKGEGQQAIDDEDGWKMEGQKIEETYAEGPALDSLSLKIDDCGVSAKNCLHSDGDVRGAKFSHLNAETSDSQGLSESEVPFISVTRSEADNGPVYQNDIELMEASCLEKIHNESPRVKERNENCEKDYIMSVDKDELLTPESSDPLTLSSDPVSLTSSSSPTSKRVTIDADGDGDESPKAKRITPERSAVEEENVSELKVTKNTESTSPDQASNNLPDLSSDSDDDDDDDDVASAAASRRRLIRRRNLRHRLFGRPRSSSDDSDSATDDDDNNEDIKNTDEDEEKESDEEVQKAILEILNKPLPKPNWYAVSELRKREYGYTSHQNSSSFRENVQGSLQMVKRLVLKESMKAHEGCVNALSFNRIGTLLASGSDDLNIVLWNWQRARPSLIYDSGHRSNVFQAKFMPFSGDCHVISCARDGQVRLAELSLTGVCKATRKLAQHRGAAHKLALEMDSPNVFLSCGEDAVTYLFDLREEKPFRLVTTKENDKKVPLYSIHSNPCDSRQFCVGGRDHYIRVYDKRKISEDVNGGVLKKFCPDHLINSEVKANVTCACYNYNGTEILGSYNDEDIYLFDNTMSDGATFVHKYTGHRNNATVKGVNFYGPKSEFIVSGSDCGHVYFWDKDTEAIVNFQEGDDAGVINVLEPHPTLPVLATSGLDHDVKLWIPSPDMPEIDMDVLKKTLRRNHKERSMERVSSEPEMIGGQMLWFIMHHFRNSARRRMREEGQVLSSSDDDNDSNQEDSDTNEMQCPQS